jgi:ferredoxin
MAKYKVNKKDCIGCGFCVVECPKGIEIRENGKAEIIDSQKIEKCGGEKICPYGAIKKAK